MKGEVQCDISSGPLLNCTTQLLVSFPGVPFVRVSQFCSVQVQTEENAGKVHRSRGRILSASQNPTLKAGVRLIFFQACIKRLGLSTQLENPSYTIMRCYAVTYP